MTGKELLRLLKSHGWTLIRIEGSHHVLVKGPVELSVPVHSNRELRTGTLHSILKKAGLK